MQYRGHLLRHELKFYIDKKTYILLRDRLKIVAKPDENTVDPEGYLISSIYFDDIYGSALNEKLEGVEFRKKYRIRMYERSDKIIKLECKEKYNQYISKISVTLTRHEYNEILAGRYEFLKKRKEIVCKALYARNKISNLKPVVTVEYLREAYVYPYGNVRVTFDKDIVSSRTEVDVFDTNYITTKVLTEDVVVLEVKYDDYLPAIIKDVLNPAMAYSSAISKFVMCRDRRLIGEIL